MAKIRPYSYHTFLFPFLWDDGGQIKKEKFRKSLSSGWKEDTIYKDDNTASLYSREGYATYQYFNEATRKALLPKPDEKEIVECFFYEPLNHRGSYVISKKEGEKETSYSLNINAVRLKVFNTGVAVLVYELEYVTDLPNEEAMKNVMRINEYGRRLYPPYLPEDNGYLICADKITVYSDHLTVFSEDNFRQRIRFAADDPAKCDCLIDPKQIPAMVTNLFEPGSEITAAIEPAIDDRMFVCCCISDDNCANHFLGYQTSYDWENEAEKKKANIRRQAGKWAFRNDFELGQELYALMNIDAGADSCCCNSRKDLDKYFDEQLYTRWAEYGTLYGVTNHSFLCLTGSNVDDSVINPFLTLYVQMSILVLAQRASMISFDKEITVAAAHDDIQRVMGKSRNQLVDLQQRFAIFQGELLLTEVTPQIQGIELYEKLQKMLFIPQLEKNIQNQMNNLYGIARTAQGNSFNTWGRIIAVIGLLMGILRVEDLERFIPQNCQVLPMWLLRLFVIGVLTASFFVLPQLFIKIKNRNHKRK